VPPRFAYWTILIDNTATAFRAQHADDLLPTLVQLRRTNSNVVMKWFARGRLWESPEEARDAARKPKPVEKRSRDWRPGGQHQDPRARFDKRRKPQPRPHGFGSGESREPQIPRAPRPKPGGKTDRRPWVGKKSERFDQRPWKRKPTDRKPWSDRKPGAFARRPKPDDTKRKT